MAEKTRKNTASTRNSRSTGQKPRTKNASRARAAAAARKNRRRQILKRRIIFGIAVFILLFLIVSLFSLLLKKTGGKKATVNTLTVTEEKVTYEELSSQEDLSKSEVKSYAKDTIAEYNKEAKEKKIHLDKVDEEDGVIYLKTSYDSVETYGDFTSYEAFGGTVKEAKKKGYDFNTSFVAVKDGVAGENVTVDEVTKDNTKHVLIIRENCTFVVDGNILYVTEENTSVTDAHTVVVSPSKDNADASVLTYIVYE